MYTCMHICIYKVVYNLWYKPGQGDFIAQNKVKIKNNKIALQTSFSKKMYLNIRYVRIVTND